MSARAYLALAGLAAILVGGLFLEYQSTDSEDATLPPASRRTSAPPQPGVASSFAPAGQARIDTVLGRPLFRSGRRPPPPDAAAGAVSSGLPRLTGVLVSRTGKSLIFAGGADGKPVIVVEGGRIGPYVVQSIGVGQALVLGPDGAKIVRPTFGSGPAVQPAGGAAAGAAPGQPSILDLLRNGPPPSVGIPGLPPPPALSTVPNSTGPRP